MNVNIDSMKIYNVHGPKIITWYFLTFFTTDSISHPKSTITIKFCSSHNHDNVMLFTKQSLHVFISDIHHNYVNYSTGMSH